jgi:predicted helicase
MIGCVWAKSAARLRVNSSLTLSGIPAAAFDYVLSSQSRVPSISWSMDAKGSDFRKALSADKED